MALIFRQRSGGVPQPLQQIEARCRRYLPIVILLGLIASLLEGLGIGLLIPMLTIILSSSGSGSYGPVLETVVNTARWITPQSPILGLSILVFGLVLCKAAVQIVNGILVSFVEGSIGRDIRDALAAKMLKLDFSFYLRNDTARLVTLIDTESWKVTEAVGVIFSIAVGASAVFIFSAILIFANWQLSLMVATGLLISRLLQLALSKRLLPLSRAVTETNRDLGEQMMQIVRAIRVIRLFGQEKREYGRFIDFSERVRTAMLRSARSAVIAMPMIEIILSSIILLVLIIASNANISVPSIAAFLILLYRMQGPLMMVHHGYIRLSGLQGSIEEVEWLIGQQDAHIALHNRPMSPVSGEDIVFEDVTYGYGAAEQKAVHELNFVIPGNSILALVGRSGAGKSTIVNLLCRLVEPENGRILVGNADIGLVDASWWRSNIAIAGQDIDLISDTVAQNIAFGREGASAEDISEAARMADAHDFIMALPNGYDTFLGAIGFGLSGGQRQRIGLARALLRQPEILILDEATSAVDGISEQVIMDLLQQHRRFGRAIVISHRASTLQLCDYGVVIEGGRILEVGALRDLSWYRAAMVSFDDAPTRAFNS